MKWLYYILRSEEATTAVEYAVMLAMVLMATIGAISSVGVGTGGMWSGIIAELRNAGFPF